MMGEQGSRPDEPESVTDVKPADDAIDLGQLQNTLKGSIGETIKIEIPPLGVEGPQRKDDEVLEEIADDLVDVPRRLRALEKGQKELEARVAQLEAGVRTAGQAQVREIRQLRTDLLGDRKTLMAVNLFNGIVQSLDSLRTMEKGLESESGSAVYNQVHALLQMLKMMLRGMGIVEYEVEKGADFDPQRMECLDFADGKAGLVLETARPGYAIHTAVVRPAGVIVGRSALPEP